MADEQKPHTATEIMESRDAPDAPTARFQAWLRSKIYGPMIERELEILRRRGIIKPLHGHRLGGNQRS